MCHLQLLFTLKMQCAVYTLSFPCFSQNMAKVHSAVWFPLESSTFLPAERFLVLYHRRRWMRRFRDGSWWTNRIEIPYSHCSLGVHWSICQWVETKLISCFPFCHFHGWVILWSLLSFCSHLLSPPPILYSLPPLPSCFGVTYFLCSKALPGQFLLCTNSQNTFECLHTLDLTSLTLELYMSCHFLNRVFV